MICALIIDEQFPWFTLVYLPCSTLSLNPTVVGSSKSPPLGMQHKVPGKPPSLVH